MCIMCDGASHDEGLLAIHAGVVRRGWAIQGVVGHDPPEVDWLYSVGLSEGFGHPELVVVGVEIPEAAQAVNELGEMICAGRRLVPGSSVELSQREVGLDLVHPAHVENGLMAMWHQYYASRGQAVATPAALQVVFPGACYCREHQHAIPRLSNPKARLELAPLSTPNRSERRARGRR